jgi:hypothetical protein
VTNEKRNGDHKSDNRTQYEKDSRKKSGAEKEIEKEKMKGRGRATGPQPLRVLFHVSFE